MTALAIITARGGSKGIPQKNLAPLAGIPLLGYTIDAAKDSKLFDEIVVNSDCEKILAYASSKGVTAQERPAELAQDLSPTEPVICQCIETLAQANKQFETAILLQPTSPLRTGQHIREAKRIYDEQQAAMVTSVVKPEVHPMKAYRVSESGDIIGAYGDDYPYRPRQSLPDCYFANGAIYVFDVKDFMSRKGFPKENIKPYMMSVEDSIDIDTPDDLLKVESILKRRYEHN